MSNLNHQWIGKTVKYEAATGRKIKGTIRDCITHEEISATVPGRTKLLVLQKIDFSETDLTPAVRFRVGYYVKKTDKLTWARYAPFLQQDSLKALLKQAQDKGWV